MAETRTAQERRRSAQQRFRQGFLDQASERLRDFAHLLADEPESVDSVSAELRRLSETAGSLDLATVARAAKEAARELEAAGEPIPAGPEDTVDLGGTESPDWARVLRRVANAIRHTVGRLRFGPIVIVGVDGEAAERLRQDAETVCEPVQVYQDLASFAAGLHTEQPTCVVLPVAAIEGVRHLAARERFVVLVHGPPAAWKQRMAAIEAGADGFLIDPFHLSDVTRLVRWRSQPSLPFEVLLLADHDDARDALVAAMAQARIPVITATDPSELAPALESGTPRAVVLGAEVAGRPALALAQMVRSHPRFNHVPVLVVGRPDDAGALRAAGVDDVIRGDAPVAQAVQRVVDRLARLAALPWERDPVSGVANRLGVLDALDDELARASRTGEVLSVVMIAIEGLHDAITEHGTSAYRLARRHLTALMGEGLRRTDIWGELAVGELLVALPTCSRDVALERIEAIHEAFLRLCQLDVQLMNLRFVVGAADTQAGLAGIAPRAEHDLRVRMG